jgi:hypothetical protein
VSGESDTATEPIANNAPQRTKAMTLRNFIQMLVFVLAIKPFMALFIGLRVRGREHLAQPQPFVLSPITPATLTRYRC